jgi:hypothetical protein
MRRKAFWIAIPVLAAGSLLAWIAGGCLPYVTEPEAEPWAESQVANHLAVVFSGKDADSGTHEYTFNAAYGGLVRLALSAKLEQGTAVVTITDKTTLAVVVNTGAEAGMGPTLRCDLANLSAARDYGVKVVTEGAIGQVSINLDIVTPVIGFTWDRQFPDVYTYSPPDPTEEYSWACDGTADLVIRASLRFTTQSTMFQVLDQNDVQVFSQTLTGLLPPGDETSAAVQQTVGDPTPVPLTGTAGRWKVRITHAGRGHDSSMRLTLQ